MKIFTLQLWAFLVLFLTSSLLSAQTIYVDASAVGTNDGSSWTNAYTDLDAAIDNAMAGMEVWVAAGTYKPGGMAPDTTSFFDVKFGVALYGGFTGTETMRSERAPSVNTCLITGDIAGDDIAGNTTDNRADNVKHVFWAVDTIDNTSIIDGFTVKGGHAYNSPEGGDTRRGGGILAYGGPIIRDCIFEDNHGHFGGAMYPRFGGADNIIIENCEFINNTGGSGGAMYINSVDNGQMTNCNFRGNQSSNSGGAIYYQNSTFVYQDCNFNGNACGTDNRGGAIYNTDSGASFFNCDFTNNIATRTGGAIHNRSDDSISVVIDNCSFINNESRWGGAMTNYDSTTQITISNCTFEQNEATTSGGALSNGFKARVSISDCDFKNNRAEDATAMSGLGGAIFNQNDSTRLSIDSCLFEENISAGSGGAFYTGARSFVSFSNSIFSTNRAVTGGAISYSPDTAEVSEISINNCIFNFNVAQNQGGALNFGNATANLVNCLIETNVASNDGFGGAISNNASFNQRSTVSIMNSTIAMNIGVLSAGISQWEEDTSATATVTMQNTILFNPDGTNYAIEDGMPEIFSNGGNLSGDNSVSLTNTNDLMSSDPLFIDVFTSDFHLMAGSPCINAGIPTGAPPFDLEGMAREGNVDIGAFEFRTVATEELVDNSVLKVFPNPGEGAVWVELENEWKGTLQVRLFNSLGQQVMNRVVSKDQALLREELDIRSLASGVYQLSLSNGQQLVSRTVVRL